MYQALCLALWQGKVNKILFIQRNVTFLGGDRHVINRKQKVPKRVRTCVGVAYTKYSARRSSLPAHRIMKGSLGK
jgi:hypothetical protein